MSNWVHICVEAFCLYNSSKDKKTEFFQFAEDESGEWVHDKDGTMVTESIGIRDNPSYVDAERPKFCKDKYGEDVSDMTPHSNCWMNDCKFLATCPINKKEHLVMVRAWEKASKRGEFDDLESDISTNGGDGGSSSFPNNEDDN